jgi:lipopolysaccharide/colanic/teichoic acid biosynthesis glycosyltransferase
LLNQTLFQHALVRQQKQADRFEESFGLVLISIGRQPLAQLRWPQAIEALRGVARSTDIVGWFEEGLVLGLIRSREDMDHLEAASSLQATVERELARRVSPDSGAVYRVDVEVYSPGPGAACPRLGEAKGFHRSTGDVLRQSAKRVLDVAGSATLLVVTSPVLLVVGALVKLTSDGPVFFRQERIGEHARPFMMLKFRTMQVNAAHDIHQQFVAQYIQGGQVRESQGGTAPVFKIVADPRVTKIGHFLRRSSLDELPQFWNVLKGDMSLVGPRPPLPYEVKVYKPWHKRRVLEAKPGITGLWQVTGRSRTTFDEMVRLDLRYARQQSVWIDLKILLATPRAVLSGKGAH